MSVSSPELKNSPFLTVDGKKYPYSEKIKYAGKPDVHERLKMYEEPHIYDFETVSESQISEQRPPSSIRSSEPDSKTKTNIVFDEMDISGNLLPILEINNTNSSQKVAVQEVIERLELISSRLYLAQKIQDAEKLFDDLKQLHTALQTHFEKVYQQHTDEMYASVDEVYKKARQGHEKPSEFESLLSKEQHNTFEKILAAQDELSQFKFQAEYCLKRLRQNHLVRSETWQTAELLPHAMTKTRACLLDESGVFHKIHSETEEWIPVPTQYLAKLKHHGAINHDSDSTEIRFTPAELWEVTVKNLKVFKNKYSNITGVWDINHARKECDEILVVFDYLIDNLKPKRAEDANSFNNYMTLEALRTDVQNFRDALKETNHSEMYTTMSGHLRKASETIRLPPFQL